MEKNLKENIYMYVYYMYIYISDSLCCTSETKITF